MDPDPTPDLIIDPQAHYCIFQSAQHLYEKREGSGARSIPLTNGSGSMRPENMRVRIRIPNTAEKIKNSCKKHVD
jgi:hypothetical protein